MPDVHRRILRIRYLQTVLNWTTPVRLNFHMWPDREFLTPDDLRQPESVCLSERVRHALLPSFDMSSFTTSSFDSGKLIMNALPAPSFGWTLIAPPCCSIMPLVMYSPNPRPLSCRPSADI